MPEYTVKQGDTLSSIGARNGVNYRSITGYRSGNPNLIYPGEVVRWGATTPAPASAPAQAAPAPAPASPSQAQQDEARWSAEGDSQYQQLGAFEQAAKSPLDIYNSALESLGIADARTRVSGLKTQLMNTENLLRNVDPNVSARTSNSLVTEAQRQKLVAQEQAPVAEQLRTEGRNLENASGDYKMILGEGKTKADLEFQGQQTKRQGIIDRLNIAKDNSKNATEKKKWETQIQLEREKMAEDKRQFEASHALAVQAANKPSGGGGGGGSGSGSSVNPSQEFLSYIKGQFGSAGKNPSRQTQDAWANAWFQSKGVTSSAARQPYWDLYNSTYKRTANPYDDWLYKR